MKLQLNISEEKIASLLCTAFEGGINYWAKIVKYVGRKENLTCAHPDFSNNYINYPLNQNHAVILEEEDKTKHKLNLKAIKKGLAIFIEDYPTHFGDFMADNADATTGDIFIQCCVFGEVKYG